jgi:Ca2+-binding EF-hand superfamily protein
LATVLVALAPAALLAGEPGDQIGASHGRDYYKHWDTNGDGVISRDEAQASDAERFAKKFDALDKDQDGQLTQDELRENRAERRSAMKERFETDFRNADKNGDGSLTKEEAAAMPRLARHFDDIDTNKDGSVTQEELQAHHANHRRHGPRDGGEPPPQS